MLSIKSDFKKRKQEYSNFNTFSDQNMLQNRIMYVCMQCIISFFIP